jgi:hypothetical protein
MCIPIIMQTGKRRMTSAIVFFNHAHVSIHRTMPAVSIRMYIRQKVVSKRYYSSCHFSFCAERAGPRAESRGRCLKVVHKYIPGADAQKSETMQGWLFQSLNLGRAHLDYHTVAIDTKAYDWAANCTALKRM